MWGKLKNGDSMTKLSISFQTETKAHKTSKKNNFFNRLIRKPIKKNGFEYLNFRFFSKLKLKVTKTVKTIFES